MQGLTDSLIKTSTFHLELNTLKEAIWVSEQENFSVRQANEN